ncbi:16S rRNA (cytosine(967)-C(5))-methyltransferase RsmB [Thalassotalea sp. M1531]|uniref:16S rRNA (cytosine(967)-C(5))-methyltransferase n=1 Tax=Thalassotalea algicola TaxID=2716224 RepID=A0A7Y0LCV9_9GAMM|nr:16S rRNA (cytosine(967)-C(5))-methyltransferase RsmB [Thalassotalea algicola]NMP30820.1 16S rRNA (cytosine(967)-C(5))-methyltransferase RsmB [Thalassotalea algicola]
MSVNLRALAAKVCFAVVDQGRSLAEEIPKQAAKVEGKDKGLLQELCYGVLRYLPELENHVRHLMDKPLKGKQRVCHFLLLVGIYQLKYTRIPDHAALNETVSATGNIKCRHLKGLVNAILRSYQRNPEVSTNSLTEPVNYNHPGWFINKVKSAYPNNWQSILSANQSRPPMWLRVNNRQFNASQYLKMLEASEIEIADQDEKSGALKLASAIDVNKLPKFDVGAASVQDAAAQQSARLLGCQPGDLVLDCCAAPGGKTCHMLELTPDIEQMTAIDVDESRLVRVQENLDRIKLEAKLIAGDATNPESWWDGQLFDRILLDAPCSATGVIRRHPDIKWLRKADDIKALVDLQAQILKKMWSLLKPGGTLLYATCSILPDENSEQIQQFLATQTDAELVELPEYQGSLGWQLIPGEQDMDGFYYAKLVKTK